METKRFCGTCTACCFTHAVQVVTGHSNEVVTKTDEWCIHCINGQGCEIYNDRFRDCKDYHCLWYAGRGDKEEDRPDHLGVVQNEVSVGGQGAPILQLIEVSPGMADTQRVRRKIMEALLAESAVLVIRTPRARGGKLFFPDSMSVEKRKQVEQSLGTTDHWIDTSR